MTTANDPKNNPLLNPAMINALVGQGTNQGPTVTPTVTQPAADPAADAAAVQARQQAAIESWNKMIPGVRAAIDSANIGNGAGSDVASQAPTTDPLAIQLFFTQAIAPMLEHLASGLQGQNKQFTDLAQKNLEHFQMPESYKAIFGQSLPRQASDQNDVIAALTGAAASGPALDQLMQNVTAARQASQKAYYEELLGQVAGGGGTDPFANAAASIAQSGGGG